MTNYTVKTLAAWAFSAVFAGVREKNRVDRQKKGKKGEKRGI